MIRHYNAGKATQAEISFIDAYYDRMSSADIAVDEQISEVMKTHIMAYANRHRSSVSNLQPLFYYAAASILALIGLGICFISYHEPANNKILVMKNDVPPGGNQAILTLSNGQKIILGKQHGYLTNQGNTRIELTKAGNVKYASGAGGETGALYNTLTVPTGNKRDIILADGTEVSLDAGSTLVFPVAFNGHERSVTLTGQAYFKVKHIETQPFLIKVKTFIIKDIGTQFNVDAYNDEPQIKTTLFNGAVKMNEVLLKPGQQAVATGNNDIKVQNADLEVTGAWRNNDFIFRGQDLRETMRQIARWYNVKIVYANAPEQLHIRAAIARTRNLSAVLQLIEETGKVKFITEGRTVTVSR